MDLQTFKKLIQPIYHNWNYLSAEDMRNKAELWYEHLGDYPPEKVRQAVQTIIREDEHFPALNRLLNLLRGKRQEHQAYLPAGEPEIDPDAIDYKIAITRAMKWRFELAAETKGRYRYGTQEYWEDCMVNESDYRKKVNEICKQYGEPLIFSQEELSDRGLHQAYKGKLDDA